MSNRFEKPKQVSAKQLSSFGDNTHYDDDLDDCILRQNDDLLTNSFEEIQVDNIFVTFDGQVRI